MKPIRWFPDTLISTTANPQLGVRNFPVACVSEVAKHLKNRSTERALDLGCATARSSFELAKHFDHVDAVDFSVRLLETPTNLQEWR